MLCILYNEKSVADAELAGLDCGLATVNWDFLTCKSPVYDEKWLENKLKTLATVELKKGTMSTDQKEAKSSLATTITAFGESLPFLTVIKPKILFWIHTRI